MQSIENQRENSGGARSAECTPLDFGCWGLDCDDVSNLEVKDLLRDDSKQDVTVTPDIIHRTISADVEYALPQYKRFQDTALYDGNPAKRQRNLGLQTRGNKVPEVPFTKKDPRIETDENSLNFQRKKKNRPLHKSPEASGRDSRLEKQYEDEKNVTVQGREYISLTKDSTDNKDITEPEYWSKNEDLSLPVFSKSAFSRIRPSCQEFEPFCPYAHPARCFAQHGPEWRPQFSVPSSHDNQMRTPALKYLSPPGYCPGIPRHSTPGPQHWDYFPSVQENCQYSEYCGLFPSHPSCTMSALTIQPGMKISVPVRSEETRVYTMKYQCYSMSGAEARKYLEMIGGAACESINRPGTSVSQAAPTRDSEFLPNEPHTAAGYPTVNYEIAHKAMPVYNCSSSLPTPCSQQQQFPLVQYLPPSPQYQAVPPSPCLSAQMQGPQHDWSTSAQTYFVDSWVSKV